MKPKPPFLLHILAFCCLLAALSGFFGVVQTTLTWNWLLAANYQPPPVFLIAKNTFYSLSFLVAAFILWIRLPWAPAYCAIVTLTASTWFWLDRMAFNPDPQPFKEHIFLLALNVILLGLTLFSLFLLQPYMRSHSSVAKFPAPPGDDHDQTSV